MASAISGFINSIKTAVYGEQVRSAIVGALEACYSDVESPSLNQAAFTAAINEAYAGGILDIQTVTNFNDMTNDKIIYRYNGTAAGKQKGLYYFSALSNSWVLIGSQLQRVSSGSYMTDANTVYYYTGTENGMFANTIYYHNGEKFVPIRMSVSGIVESDIQLVDPLELLIVNLKETASIPVEEDELYFLNPLFGRRNHNDPTQGKITGTLAFLDSSKQPVNFGTDGTSYELTEISFNTNNGVSVSGSTVTVGSAQTVDAAKRGAMVYKTTYYAQSPVKYVEFSVTNPIAEWGFTTAENVSTDYIPYTKKDMTIAEDATGYWKQFENKVYDNLILNKANEAINAISIRQLNASRDCIRVGTFNLFVQLRGENHNIAKKIFADYGCDFVATQETANYVDDYPNNLTSLLFPYVDNTQKATDSPYLDNKVISRYPIASATKVQYTPLSGYNPEWRGYTRALINLPRYKDYYPNGDKTLAIYSTHFDPTDALRLDEAEQLVAALQADTADFIVVCMDSNDFSLDKPTWEKITNIGFKQVHDGSSKTEVVDRALFGSSSLDQIFCSPNMDVVFYNIINASNYKYIGNEGTEHNASDHDFVFADLKLNYDVS